jgi:hypothetical protein
MLSRKEIKKLDRVPLDTFLELCEGKEADLHQLRGLSVGAPRSIPLLQPHLAMDRLSGTGLEGMLFMMPLSVYRPGPDPVDSPTGPPLKEPPPQICFFLKIRQSEDAALIENALKRVCGEGWGHAKSRGLGRIGWLAPAGWQHWQPKTFDGTPNGFVSLSHFCPSADDPRLGHWKIRAKHPVPSQLVDGQRIVLGEGRDWRVRSFLRLTPGSCFRFRQEQELQEHYGRMLSGTELLQPSIPGDPPLFHYALAYPWPLVDRPIGK